MGADLIATVIPKLTEESYEKVIAAANDCALATAAFRAGYQGDFGVGPSGESVDDLISDEDPAAVELILSQARRDGRDPRRRPRGYPVCARRSTRRPSSCAGWNPFTTKD